MKDKKEKAKKSLLMRILTYGAREKAKNAPREPYLSKDKIKKFRFKR